MALQIQEIQETGAIIWAINSSRIRPSSAHASDAMLKRSLLRPSSAYSGDEYLCT
jgi:hypothetical protein